MSDIPNNNSPQPEEQYTVQQEDATYYYTQQEDGEYEYVQVPVQTMDFTLPPLLFWPGALIFHEWLLLIFDRESSFFSLSLLPITFFAGAAGFLIGVLLDLLPRKPKHVCAYALTVAWTVFLCIEYCCRSYFKSYFSLSYTTGMTGNVLGNFLPTMMEVILARLPFILLSFVPLIALIVWRKAILCQLREYPRARMLAVIFAVVLQIAGMLMGHFGPYKAEYTYDFTADRTIPRFGLVSQVRLEAVYGIVGIPETPLVDITDIVDALPQEEESAGQPAATGYNVLDIDFNALAEKETNKTLKAMDQYFAAKPATRKNQYTGMFAGKNLIVITAEAFSPYVISPELTPTLYKLTHEGFVFTDYYQPAWGQSTTGGEFAVMTGLIPTWINGNVSFYTSSYDYMPLALGNQLSALGYDCRAWHNNYYAYYDRDKTHPNLGYDYVGTGNGLVLEVGGNGSWPYSDLEMMEKTVDTYLTNYVENGTPFHTYYMTVSGHANWGWTQYMSARHRADVEATMPDASTTVQAYVAANLEVELAVRYLYQRLSKAGALEDTVICLTADHYPYAMVDDNGDYYQELSGIQDTEKDISRYRNTLMLWCGSMEEPVIVDTPCTAIDILPTLCNLFGLNYDSRLLSGRDVLDDSVSPTAVSASMPIAIIPTAAGVSWITNAGTYDANGGTFTPKEGVTVPDDYAGNVSALVDAKYTYAKMVIAYDYYNAVYPGGSGGAASYVVVPTKPRSTEQEVAEGGGEGFLPATEPAPPGIEDYGGDPLQEEDLGGFLPAQPTTEDLGGFLPLE